jgi:hypothetical protein
VKENRNCHQRISKLYHTTNLCWFTLWSHNKSGKERKQRNKKSIKTLSNLCSFMSLSRNRNNTHTHTHTHTYIYNQKETSNLKSNVFKILHHFIMIHKSLENVFWFFTKTQNMTMEKMFPKCKAEKSLTFFYNFNLRKRWVHNFHHQ